MGNYFDKKIIVSGLTVAAIVAGVSLIFSWIFINESLDIIVFIIIFILTLVIVFIAGFITGKLKSGPEWLLLLLEHWSKTKINRKDKASDKDDKTSNKDDKTKEESTKEKTEPTTIVVVVSEPAHLQRVMTEITNSQKRTDK